MQNGKLQEVQRAKIRISSARRPSRAHVRHGDFVPEGQARDKSLHMRFVTALRPGPLAILCILLVGCTPPGPSAELTLGWGHSIVGLAELEGIFMQHGFNPEMRESISTGSAGESAPAWRHRGEGKTFSYFRDGPRDDYGLRAVLSLSDIAGRLRVIVFGRGACQDEAFNRDRQQQLAKLATAIGERFKRKVTFKYDPGGRC
jgi:hypothetical protein